MKIGKKHSYSNLPPVTNKFDQLKLPILEEQKTEIKKDTSNFSDSINKNGKAITNITLNFSEAIKKENTDPIKKTKTNESKNETEPPKKTKLSEVEIGVGYFNDSNMFLKGEDDLGMTTSYNAYTNLSFLNKNGSKTNISLNNSSALHTQYLSENEDFTKQSTLTVNDYEIGIENNNFLIKNPNINVGTKLGVKTVDRDPNSGWAKKQISLHESMDLRQYENQENPFIENNETYITPMATVGIENEKITKSKLYLKTEAKAGIGTMVPLQKESNFYTPIRAEASGSVKFGYSYKSKPLFYVKADANISNEPLPYNRDHGTMGSFGLAVGNEITVMKKKKFDMTLGLESKILKPFGNLSNNPLPDQYGKFDVIHEMFNFKLKINLK